MFSANYLHCCNLKDKMSGMIMKMTNYNMPITFQYIIICCYKRMKNKLTLIPASIEKEQLHLKWRGFICISKAHSNDKTIYLSFTKSNFSNSSIIGYTK